MMVKVVPKHNAVDLLWLLGRMRFPVLVLCLLFWSLTSTAIYAQQPSGTIDASTSAADQEEKDLTAPTDVEIDPTAEDSDIAQRLVDILRATTWFVEPKVRVDEGVVFLTGATSTPEHKSWAGNLARNTQDVVAVVNRLTVTERSMWDLTPAWQEIQRLGRETVQMLPLLGLALFIVILAWFATGWSVAGVRHVLSRRWKNRLLVSVLSKSVAIPMFLIGLYLALRVSGLTQIAATVVGGTGLVGLVLGIAFRDIAENFLASVLISVQRPFALGDQIELEGYQGIVQSVTLRGTLLLTLDGNHVQIPNATVYKSIIRNLTANPNIRGQFLVGIDYGDSVAHAQQVILEVLRNHPAVLKTTDPMVLVDELAASTVNLRVFFWIDGHEHSLVKVRSSLIRLVKLAVEEAGLHFPDESREVIFPKGVPVLVHRSGGESEIKWEASDDNSQVERSAGLRPASSQRESSDTCSAAEDGLVNEREAVEKQASQTRMPEAGENLLAS